MPTTVDSILYFWEQYNKSMSDRLKKQIEANTIMMKKMPPVDFTVRPVRYTSEERAWLASEFHKPKLESPNPILISVPIQATDRQVKAFLGNLKTRALADAGYFDNDYTDDREIHIDLE